MKNLVPIILLVLVIGMVAYFYRWIFSYRYDAVRGESELQNSQYVWPRGSLTMDDGAYYKIVGYKLVDGANPFYLNVETPPLAKSFYGLAEHLTSNPYYVSFSFYILSIFCIWYLASLVTGNRTVTWLSTFIFALNPLTIYQVEQTMLDLPLTVFLMIHLIFLFNIKSSKQKFFNLVMAAIALGLMAGVKIAYYIPGILLLDLVYLFLLKLRQVKYYFGLMAFSAVGYVLAWFIYFIRHPNPIPWIRLHQNIVNFYWGSQGASDHFNVLSTIFLNRYNLWAATPTKIIPMVEWSILLPLGVLVIFYNLIMFKGTLKNGFIFYLTMLGIILLLMNSLIGFWPRYLLVLIPVLSILFSNFIYKYKKLTIIFFLVYSISVVNILVFNILAPN